MAERIYVGGVTNTTLHLEGDGTIIAEEKQDCAGILDYTQAGRNQRFSADACEGMLRHEAEIPMTVYIEECRKRGARLFSAEADLVMEWILAAPEYANFRAAPSQRDPHIRMKGLR